MVNQNQESVQAPLPEQSEAAPPTDMSEGVDSSSVPEDVQAPPAPPTAPAPDPASGTESQPAPAPESPATPEAAPVYTGPSQEEILRLQQQAAEYEAVRNKAQLQQEARNYQKQLENQGYLPEQAEGAARQYVQSKSAQNDLMKKADMYGQHLTGKMAAAEHFAQKFNLNMGDLAVLRQAETPEMMEALATNISERRNDQQELTRLRQAQVPAQQFDNSQGTPNVAANDSSWLDRYNAGDDSPQAVSAARRAAGLS